MMWTGRERVATIWWLLLLWIRPGLALYAEDAGQLDFVVPTTGHGPVVSAAVVVAAVRSSNKLPAGVLVTSGSSSCHLAGRHWETGQVLWRRWVGGNNDSTDCPPVVWTVVGDMVVTATGNTMLRGWNVSNGSLQWELLLPPPASSTSTSSKKSAQLWAVPETNHVAWQSPTTTAGPVVLLDAMTGTMVNDDGPAMQRAKASKPNVDLASMDRHQVICNPADTTVQWNYETKTLVATSTKSGSTTGEYQPSDNNNNSLDQLWLMDCQPQKVSVLATSRRGTTAKITFANNKGAATVHWTAHEDLAQITSALMLDASHEAAIPTITDESQPAAEPERVLQLSTRLALQWQSVQSLLTGSQQQPRNNRDSLFGFVKIAVLLSSHGHVYGMETAGPRRTQLRYQIALPSSDDDDTTASAAVETTVWQHRLVHGSTNAEKSVHGIHGGAHTRQVLVLSHNNKNNVQWICFDGTTGDIHSRGSFTVASSIVQVLPVAHKGGGGTSTVCRQDAILLLQDHSLVSVTMGSGNDGSSNYKSIANYKNLFAHYFDRTTSTLHSLGISTADAADGTPSTYLVGSAVFPGEEIVAVAYPLREEVIQSPCSVLGDDSLLLKYLNPHLAVIVTMTSSAATADDAFPLKPAVKKSSTTKQKRKPVGVTQPGDGTTQAVEDQPNFFVTVVDTVSARVLYRISHVSALRNPHPSVLVSENWVFYTFVNAKTRKAELGVLSLYEGMIDKSGLTAFASPEQLTSFSSLNARETKPVVLAKTYTIPMPATALGITSTRSGISGRQLLLATLDGKIQAIPRKMLEPRRPLGQVKESEKKEGLVQYHELIQTVSYMTLSHNQTVEGVQSIVTTPTDVESQTLLLAYGGPDIFYARTAPSKAFDLLPDNFNRVLLSIVVAGLVVALVTLRHLVSKKVVKQGWI